LFKKFDPEALNEDDYLLRIYKELSNMSLKDGNPNPHDQNVIFERLIFSNPAYDPPQSDKVN